MLQEPLYLCYDLESLQGTLEQSLDQRVQSMKRSPSYLHVGCIYAPYKVNPNIFQFYFDFMDIFHHTSMHPLFHNIYEFYPIFYDFILSFVIYNNHLYLR